MDLYRPEFEHDACGVAFVVDMHGRRSHDIVRMGLASLCHLEHRGASGAEVNTGDGAGILLQIPDRFYREVAGLRSARAGGYATGIAFLPADADGGGPGRDEIERLAADEDLLVLGWREVPDRSLAGRQHRPQRHAVVPSDLRGQRRPATPDWTSSGGPSSCASELNTRSPASTSPPSRRERSSTRGC